MKKLLLIAAVAMLAGCTTNYLLNDVQAEYMAHLVIKAHLTDPDPQFDNATAKMATYPDTSYVFNGTLMALDKQGGKSAVNYNVGIKFKGGNPQQDSSWTVKFCNLK